MSDRIFEIGEAGLEATDQAVKKLMDNIVNAEVPGYRKSEVITRAFPLELDSATQRLTAMKPQVENSYYSNIQGALIKTDSQLDLALGSDGYFVVLGSWGEGFTRDGRFHLDSDGRLLSIAGNFPVMGKGGPIVVTPGAQVEFSQTGDVLVDGTVVDTLRVVNPEQSDGLQQLSGSLFQRKDNQIVMQDVDPPRVIQGYVESSNTNISDLMMEMIMTERIYNLNAKVIASRDANLARAMELGRPTQ